MSRIKDKDSSQGGRPEREGEKKMRHFMGKAGEKGRTRGVFQGKGAAASMTVEAALLFPVLFAITFFLVQATFARYEEVQGQSGRLYDALLQEDSLGIADKIRIADTAFELFQ